MKIIGLTGNSGSGKSYIANIFLESNAYVIDADKIGHEVLIKNSLAYNEIVDFFGDEILDTDKNINRKVLGKIVFTDKQKLNKLNDIAHKYILKIIMNRIDEAKSKAYQLTVIDAPLLINTNLHKICHKTIVVHADESIKMQRIMQRDNISEQDALDRLNNQSPFRNLKKYADIVILNNKNDNSLREEVENIVKGLC